MNSTIGVTVLLALVSGLCYLATKHPQTFRERLFTPLLAAVFVVQLGSLSWSLGSGSTFKAALRFIVPERIDEFKTVTDALGDVTTWVLLSCFFLCGCLVFLFWLAGHIFRDSQPTKSE